MKKIILSAAATIALGLSSNLFAGEPGYTVVSQPQVLPAPIVQPTIVKTQSCSPCKQEHVIVQQPVVEKKIIIQKVPVTVVQKVPVYYTNGCGYTHYAPTCNYGYNYNYTYGYSNYSTCGW